MRNWLTNEYYPDKMDLSEFVRGMEEAIGGFEDNMKSLKEDGPHDIERWTDMLTAWCEIFPPIDMKKLVEIYRDYGCIPLGAAGADFSIRAFYEAVLKELGITYD